MLDTLLPSNFDSDFTVRGAVSWDHSGVVVLFFLSPFFPLPIFHPITVSEFFLSCLFSQNHKPPLSKTPTSIFFLVASSSLSCAQDRL